MKLKEWEIWHDYYTFYNKQHVDLNSSAKYLLESGITTLISHSNGRTFIMDGNKIINANTTILMSENKNRADLKFELDDDDFELKDFNLESWYQLTYMRYNELRIFEDMQQVPSEYLKFSLGKFEFIKKDGIKKIDVYPIVKLYETGVVIVAYRLIGPKREVPLEEFITEYVNVSNCKFDKVLVPPAITKNSVRAYYNYRNPNLNIIKRFFMEYLQGRSDQAVDESCEEINDIDFKFKLAPIGNDGNDTLSSIANTLFNTIGFIIGNPRKGLKFIIMGQKPFHIVGNYWQGKPNVYVFDFDKQKNNSEENEKKNGKDFARILARSMLDKKGLKDFLVPDQRLFDDYNAYMGLGITLWVWSKKGRQDSYEYFDANNGQLVYDAQIKVEFMEYVYMLYRGLYELSSDYSDLKAILYSQEVLINIEHSLKESSYYGEIRDLFNFGWKQMGMEDLKDSMNKLLQIKEAQSAYSESKRTSQLGFGITILFGLISVPQLADNIVEPIWEILDYPLPDGENEIALFYILISTLIMSVILKILSISINKK